MDGLPRKVLVVRLGAIGDVVNALVFAAALKDACAETEISWVVHPLARPLVENNPVVDRVHVWHRNAGIGALLQLVTGLRRERYDLVVDLQRILKSAVLARLAGASRVLGYDRARAKEGSWLWTKERLAGNAPTSHMVDQYLEFARYLGIENPAVRHVLPEDPKAEDWADGYVAELGAAPILVNLGATKSANRWLPERFGELAVGLARKYDAPVCLTGGPADGEAERAALGAIATLGGSDRVRSTVGATDLSQLVALTRRARLFVGCDTGPMHIASACGTPVVALFGPADPRRTGPYFDQAAVVRVPPPCAPCGLRDCNQPRHACMEDISIGQVLAATAGGGIAAR